MKKSNCWEYKKCGREIGGRNISKLGVCPASICLQLNGINDGTNGGRTCWAIVGTFCNGKVQGTFAAKIDSCQKCEFFELVQSEEGFNYVSTSKILPIINPELQEKTM